MFSRNKVTLTPEMASDYLRTADYKNTQISMENAKEKSYSIESRKDLVFWFQNGRLISGHEDMLAIIMANISVPCELIRLQS